jgi:hypothetical protein
MALINITVKCEQCDNPLVANVSCCTDITNAHHGDLVMTVEPCRTCSETQYDVGFAHGQDNIMDALNR